VPISIAVDGAVYTGRFFLGSRRDAVDVMLDTGSSTFAVDARFYRPLRDLQARATRLVQEDAYADDSGWRGPVVQTNVTASGKGRSIDLPGVTVAVAQRSWGGMFDTSHGILGLAYRSLNDAIELTRKTLPPRYTGRELEKGRKVFVPPYFQQLEFSGLEAGKFAFLTRRFTARVADGGDPLTDPVNQGVLVLGGGEEATSLYRGAFQTVAILSNDYWSVNLKQVMVGRKPAIHVQAPRRTSELVTNAIIDSGTNRLSLPQPLYGEVLKCFSQEQRRLVRKGLAAASELHLAAWPTLSFVLEGLGENDATLRVSPQVYWQFDTDSKGRAACGISYQGGDGVILGLPLMNAYYTVFDSQANHGMGLVRFARPQIDR